MDDGFTFGLGADSAVYLWPLAAVVLWLAAHVAIGYVRHGARAQGGSLRLGCLAAAALALGTGLWGAMVLGMATAAGYALAYSPLWLLTAWLLALAAMSFALAWTVLRRSTPTVVLSALLAAAGMLVTQAALVLAAGLVPGPVWNLAVLIVALLLAPVGSVAGFLISFIGPGREGVHRQRWRWAASALVAVAALVGQELVMAAAAVSSQRGSIYTNSVPSAVACLLAGFAVPAVLVVMLVDLRVRRARASGVRAPRRRRMTRA
jgi:NO-binding membrane sensor protein with MHYT domain